MNVEYINPFIDSAKTILEESLGSKVQRKDLYLKKTTVPTMGVAAVVGLVSDKIQGRVLFDMNEATAIFVASKMNGDVQFTSLADEMVKSTIMELANMITAGALTKLDALGHKIDLTPPTLITGSEISFFSQEDLEALIVPLEVGPDLMIEVNVGIRDKH